MAGGEDAWRELDDVARAFARAAERRVAEVMKMPNAAEVMPRLFQMVGLLTSLVSDCRQGINAELRALLDLKSEQLRVTAHELRRPLGVMTGYLSLIHEGTFGPVPESMEPPLQKFEAGAAEMQVLLDALAEYARLEDRAQALRRQLTRIGNLVSDAIRAVEPQAAARNVTVEHVTLAGLDILAAVDRRQLRIAIVNLISNAVKFTTDGSKVTVTVGSDDPNFTIAVADQGPGIDPAEAERIFERWHRSPNATAGGLGLGLSIVRQIVESHGGRLAVESAPGEGATFTIVLPR